MATSEQLPRRAQEIMDVLYGLGGNASVEDVRARLIDAPSYSAVRTMLSRLEGKGLVRHREDGPRYLYTPTPRRNTVQKTAVQKLVNVFFGGSPSAAAAALVRQENWTDEELEALTAEIERARRSRK